MHIERMHKMIECLTEKALCELEKGTENVDTCEMGQVVDMIKDLNEAEYKAVIVKAMKKADEEKEEYDKMLLRELKEEYGEDTGRRFYDHYRYSDGRFAPKGHGTYRGYSEPYYHMTPEMYRDMDRDTHSRMYYTETGMNESGYDRAKRNYTETKEMHRGNTPEDKKAKMQELEKYAKSLTEDVVDMVSDMSDEEKNLLRTKMQILMQKIQ
nr:MAG TPA: hypothetical protein [Bacteriophage sp.]